MDEKELEAYKQGFIDALNIKENYNYQLFGMEIDEALDVLTTHIRNKLKSEIPNIPIGFTFEWSKRKEINEFFAKIEKQGYKVVKDNG